MSDSDCPQLTIPQSSCIYEKYDPVTLEPLNEETRLRLTELAWTESDFRGKSVIDIGMNTGLLSLEAHRLGASSVTSYDVQDPLIKFFQGVVANKGLPIRVAKRNLNSLNAPDDQADVVLFMEVLHWAVAQGSTLPQIINRLASLTREILFIEFPWSVNEPSIKAQTTLTADIYSADDVLDLLSRHFRDVQIVRFMKYFGITSGTNRVLVKASNKRPASDLLSLVPNVYPLDISLPNGRNSNLVVNSPEGYLFVKTVAKNSNLLHLHETVLDRIFDELHSAKIARIVLPKKMLDHYLLRGTVHSYMAFELIGGLKGPQTVTHASLEIRELIDYLVDLRREFRGLSKETIEKFKSNVSMRLSVDFDFIRKTDVLSDEMKERIFEVLSNNNMGLDNYLDCIQHGDIQSGNLIRTPERNLLGVDLDNISAGTAYTDGFSALCWRGADNGAFGEFAARCQLEEGRPPADHDVAIALTFVLSWLRVVMAEDTPGRRSSALIRQFCAGSEGMLDYFDSLKPKVNTKQKPAFE